MVLLKKLTRNSSSWTVVACLMLCCYFVQAGVVSKIPPKKSIWSKDRYQKPNAELNKTATECSQKLSMYSVSNNVSLTTDQKAMKNLESTTTTALTLTPKEDKFPLENDFTSTTVMGNEDVTSLESTSTISSIDGSSLFATTLQSDVRTTTITTAENVTACDVDEPVEKIPCTCGIFLSSQFKKGSQEAPIGEAVISTSLVRTYSCDGVGQKHCQTKCLEQIVQHLPNSAKILCASVDRDIRKERAYLFIKNCSNKWINTNLAAGREYSCKNREPYNCK